MCACVTLSECLCVCDFKSVCDWTWACELVRVWRVLVLEQKRTKHLTTRPYGLICWCSSWGVLPSDLAWPTSICVTIRATTGNNNREKWKIKSPKHLDCGASGSAVSCVCLLLFSLLNWAAGSQTKSTNRLSNAEGIQPGYRLENRKLKMKERRRKVSVMAEGYAVILSSMQIKVPARCVCVRARVCMRLCVPVRVCEYVCACVGVSVRVWACVYACAYVGEGKVDQSI